MLKAIPQASREFSISHKPLLYLCLTVVDYVKKLVVKVKPKDENHVHNFNCDVCFDNESNAYNVIVPILNQFASFPLAVPNHLYTDGSVVILEDLVERGFDGMHGCVALTPQQAESVLQVRNEIFN